MMAGSDDSISSAASSGSDGDQHPRPPPARPVAHAGGRSASGQPAKKKTVLVRRGRETAAMSTSSSSSSSSSSFFSSSSVSSSVSNSSVVVRHRHRHKLSHRFEFVRTLGCGTYGKVKLAVQLDTREEVAIKCIPKSKIDNAADLRRLRQEIEVMSSLRHPNIIKVVEVFESRDKIVMVMEHAAGGELYDFINEGNLTAVEAKRMFRQIGTAVRHLHKNNIVHRDLKLENVLLEKDLTVKIADFGLSSTFGHGLLDTFCGSPLYASPEIINGTPYCGPEIDCWSLGVVLYAMVYKTMPFNGADFTQLKKQIVAGDFFEPSVASDASGLIRRMLTVDPSKRITIEEILDHPWLRDEARARTGEEALPGVCYRRRKTEIREAAGSEAAGDSGLLTGEGSLTNGARSQETAKKPPAGILKRNLRRSSNQLAVANPSRPAEAAETPTPREPDAERGGRTEPKANKKGILKRQVKDTGRDSGLEINEPGQGRSGASLESGDGDPARERGKRDSGIDQDLSASCPVSPDAETRKLDVCRLRESAGTKYECKISRRHSRGKYSRVAKMWESIYAGSFAKGPVEDAAAKDAVKSRPADAADPLAALDEKGNSSSSNEDILGILDSPRLRTPTTTRTFRFDVRGTEPGCPAVHRRPPAPAEEKEKEEEEKYTRDELMGAMDAELLAVYHRALQISQAIM